MGYSVDVGSVEDADARVSPILDTHAHAEEESGHSAHQEDHTEDDARNCGAREDVAHVGVVGAAERRGSLATVVDAAYALGSAGTGEQTKQQRAPQQAPSQRPRPHFPPPGLLLHQPCRSSHSTSPRRTTTENRRFLPGLSIGHLLVCPGNILLLLVFVVVVFWRFQLRHAPIQIVWGFCL